MRSTSIGFKVRSGNTTTSSSSITISLPNEPSKSSFCELSCFPTGRDTLGFFSFFFLACVLPWLPKLNIDSRFLLCSFSGLGRSGSLWRFFTITSPLRLIDSVFSGIFGSSFSFFIVLSAFSTAISFIISALGVLSFCAGCSFLGLGFSCFEVSFVLFFSAVLVVVFLAAVFGSAFCAVFDSLFSLVFSVVVLTVVFFVAGFLAVFLAPSSFAFF